MAIPLGPPSPTGSGSQPGPLGRENPGAEAPRDPYLALLLAGLAVPPTLPPARWALTPPFHPCPRAEAAGGLISVALSLGLPRAGVTRRHLSLESGLSSTLRAAAIRPSARAPYVGTRAPVNARRARPARIAATSRRLGLAASPRAGSAAAPPRAPPPSRRPARRSPPPRRRRGTPPSRPAPRGAVRPDRPPAARQPPPVELRPRIGLAPRRHVGMGDHPGGRDRPARHDPVEQRLERRHLRLGERRKAVERPGVGELDPDRARVHVLRPAPATRPRRARRAPPRRPAARPARPRRRDSAPRPPPPDRRAARAPPRPSAWRCGAARPAPAAARRAAGRSWGWTARGFPCAFSRRMARDAPIAARRTASPRTAACTPSPSAARSWATAAAACTGRTARSARARWRSRAWIACLTAFRGRHREVMGRGLHRALLPRRGDRARRRPPPLLRVPPRRRPRLRRRLGPRQPRRRAPPTMDRVLHAERLGPPRARRASATLPAGAIFAADGRLPPADRSRRAGLELRRLPPGARLRGRTRSSRRSRPRTSARRSPPATGPSSTRARGAQLQRAVGRRVPLAGEAVAVRVDAVAVRAPARRRRGRRAAPRRRRGSGRSCRRPPPAPRPSADRSTRRPRCVGLLGEERDVDALDAVRQRPGLHHHQLVARRGELALGDGGVDLLLLERPLHQVDPVVVERRAGAVRRPGQRHLGRAGRSRRARSRSCW